MLQGRINNLSPGSFILSAILLIVFYYTYTLSLRLVRLRRFNLWAQSRGCDQNGPKEPSYAPWTLFLRKLAWIRQDNTGALLSTYLPKKYQKYGTTHQQISYFLGTQKSICTADPANLKAILATNFEDWDRGAWWGAISWPFLKPGIFTTSGAAWRKDRGMLAPAFRRGKLIDNAGIAEGHLRRLFGVVGAPDSDGWTQVVDLRELFRRFSIDSISEFMFGVSTMTMAALSPTPGSLTDAQRAFQGFDESLRMFEKMIDRRGRLGKLYWLDYRPSYRKTVRELYAAVTPFVEDMARRFKEKGSKDPSNLIESMAAQGAGAEDMVNQCMHVFIAGTITTAMALSWIFALLEAHPEVAQRLQTDVLEAFGTEEHPRRPFTSENIKAVPYIQSVILETLRLYPTSPNDSRFAACDTVLPVGGGPDGRGPLAVKKGTRVRLCMYYLHRREDLWGEDADLFRPERWEGSGKKRGWEYNAFSGGPGVCIGQQYAMNQIAFVVARFTQRFAKIQRPAGQDNLEKEWILVPNPKNGVKVRFQTR